MVLAEAFMKRNDLKKQIVSLTAAAGRNLWQDKSMPINFDTGLHVHPSQAYDSVTALMVDLQNLNVAIAAANTINSGILRDLETTTARLEFIEQILQEAERYPGDKVREQTYSSEPRIIENEWIINPKKIQEEQETLQKRKRELEKILAHNNFVTEVVV